MIKHTIKFLIVLIIIHGNSVAKGPKTYNNVTISKIISIYDGDTFKANIDNYPYILGDTISIRIYDIDTPEIRNKNKEEKKQAVKARDYLSKILLNANIIELREIKRGKYFRIIATVFADGVNVGQKMIKDGFAKPYFGDAK